MTGRAGPVVHFQEQLGDFQMGQHPVRSARQRVGFRRHSAVERGELEVRTDDGRIRQLVLRREPFHRLRLALQHGQPRLQEPLTVGLHRQAQCLLFTLCRETRRRQQVLLEVLELARALHRHCQRKVRRAEFSACDRELGRSELTPLGECGPAVEREIVPVSRGVVRRLKWL